MPRKETQAKAATKTAPTALVVNDTVVVKDTDGTLTRYGGSRSDDWNDVAACQTINALWFNSDPEMRERQIRAALAGLSGIVAKDEPEGMMAACRWAVRPALLALISAKDHP